MVKPCLCAHSYLTISLLVFEGVLINLYVNKKYSYPLIFISITNIVENSQLTVVDGNRYDKAENQIL